MSKQPLEMNPSPSMAYREGCKHLQIDVCISKPTCETIVQTPTATERGQQWDAAPTHQHLVLFKTPLCTSLIHTELPHVTVRPAGDPNPSAAGAEGPAGSPRDVQKPLDACVWATVCAWIQIYCPELDPTDCIVIFSELLTTHKQLVQSALNRFQNFLQLLIILHQ